MDQQRRDRAGRADVSRLTHHPGIYRRAIKGVELAGQFVIGVRPDGTLIVGDKAVDITSLVPGDKATFDASTKWEN